MFRRPCLNIAPNSKQYVSCCYESGVERFHRGLESQSFRFGEERFFPKVVGLYGFAGWNWCYNFMD